MYLLRLLNEVHPSYMSRAGDTVLGGIIDRLVEYMQHHFAAEEQWMDWFFDHILKTDADHGRFAKESGHTT